MNFNSIPERISHEEAPPWHRSSILGCHTRCMQPGPKAIHVLIFQPKMPINIRFRPLVLH